MSLAATASRLLNKFGEAVALSYQSGGDIDPATGEVTTPAVTVTVNAFGYPSRYQAAEVNGDTIRSGDVRLVLEKVTQRPEANWYATVDSKKYRIMDVRPVRRSAEDVIYICQIRSQ